MADVTHDAERTVATFPTLVARIMKVPIEKLRANPNQPRRTFSPEQLDELAASVKEKGIIQPLIVRTR